MTLQPNDIATQLNLWNFELFRNIQPVEYVNNVLTKEADLFPNLDLFIKRFELVGSLSLTFFPFLKVGNSSFLSLFLMFLGKLLGCNRGVHGKGPEASGDGSGVLYQDRQVLP